MVNLVVFILRKKPRFRKGVLAFCLIFEIARVFQLAVGTHRFDEIVGGRDGADKTALSRQLGRGYLLEYYEAVRSKEKAKVTATSFIKSEEWTFREIPCQMTPNPV
jgi:hypothetical protein